MHAATSLTWIDGTRIPVEGGCIVVANHISHLDPLLTAHFVYDHGRIPRYLAKNSLFRTRFVGTVLTSAKQIPVERLSRNAISAYDAAVRAVHEGECVVVYPEGTLTRDPGLWPMTGKSGAARIALATGVPVIPVGHWGAQEVLPPYSKHPHLVPRRRVVMKAGPPVPLDDLRALPQTPAVVAETTERIMSAITDIVAELRGEQPPEERFDPRVHGVKPIGNPHPRPPHHGRPQHKLRSKSPGKGLRSKGLRSTRNSDDDFKDGR
jgi:1-acyl-sn-glycerol-3-phosphate acyltransferase